MASKPKYFTMGICQKCGMTNQRLTKDTTGTYLGTCCLEEQLAIQSGQRDLPKNERSLTELRKWVRK